MLDFFFVCAKMNQGKKFGEKSLILITASYIVKPL